MSLPKLWLLSSCKFAGLTGLFLQDRIVRQYGEDTVQWDLKFYAESIYIVCVPQKQTHIFQKRLGYRNSPHDIISSMKTNKIKKQRRIFAQALRRSWRSGDERKGFSSTPTFFDSFLPRLGTQHPRYRVWRSNGSPGGILLGFGDPLGHAGVHY
jgi:ribosomal protein L39E